jgi:hypothetical protein
LLNNLDGFTIPDSYETKQTEFLQAEYKEKVLDGLQNKSKASAVLTIRLTSCIVDYTIQQEE